MPQAIAEARRSAGGGPGPAVRDGLARIGGLIVGYRAARLVFTAVAFDLFGRLAAGPRSAAQVAAALALKPRACAVLLDALAALGFLRKTGRRYWNDPAASYLLKDSSTSLFHNLRTQDRLWQAWGDLAGVLRRGGPRRDLARRLRQRAFREDYLGGMSEIARHPAREVAAALSRAGPACLLDVGGGPAAYSLAWLSRHPEGTALLLDLPGSVALARSGTSGHPAAGRLSFLAGDYRRASFGRGRFDLVLMSHITHDESAAVNRRLLRKAFTALRPGGEIAIHDFMLDASRTRPVFAALFAAHMLVYTRGGRTYTEAEYGRWLEAAGFRGLRRRAVNPGAPNETALLTGRKP